MQERRLLVATRARNMTSLSSFQCREQLSVDVDSGWQGGLGEELSLMLLQIRRETDAVRDNCLGGDYRVGSQEGVGRRALGLRFRGALGVRCHRSSGLECPHQDPPCFSIRSQSR